MPSSVIRAFSYECGTHRLIIDFQSGRRYAYLDVPPEIPAALRAAHSRGSYFNRRVRDHYAFVRLDEAHRGST